MTMINNERHYSEEEVKYLLRKLLQITLFDAVNYFKVENMNMEDISNIPDKALFEYYKNALFNFEKSEFSNDISDDNESMLDWLGTLILSAYNHDEDFNDMMEELFG